MVADIKTVCLCCGILLRHWNLFPETLDHGLLLASNTQRVSITKDSAVHDHDIFSLLLNYLVSLEYPYRKTHLD